VLEVGHVGDHPEPHGQAAQVLDERAVAGQVEVVEVDRPHAAGQVGADVLGVGIADHRHL
jgi:hypothetical protein